MKGWGSHAGSRGELWVRVRKGGRAGKGFVIAQGKEGG